ncbi:hypothetical protein CCAX7_001340 [Capsulimonas corticalis]|uniref:Uncharacterized protein n=1 Tax=Capsulimonas corticalis TaxID=2219043 RepID=A0A402CRK0_9BACT|nr:hypothetical protein [Capsulimonas corticalis]BDI28083.1 hypothetical protein CCAX7_001340 [Capsulimonas corticalis]
MPVQTRSLIDFILHNKTPVWHEWNGDILELSEALQESALNFPILSRSLGNPTQARRLNVRLFELIDRLAGKQSQPFYGRLMELMPTNGRNVPYDLEQYEARSPWSMAQIVYGWGRRLESSERHRILEFLQQDAQRECDDFANVCDSGMVAWAEICPVDEAEKLIDWVDICAVNKIPTNTGFHYAALFREYQSKVSDPRVRVKSILSKLGVVSSADIDSSDNPYRPLSYYLKNQLTKDLAMLIPSDESDFPASEDALWNWCLNAVEEVLDSGQIRLLLRDDIKHRFQNCAREMWVLSRTQNNWEMFYDHLDVISENGLRYPALKRLAYVLPANKYELWDKLFAWPSVGNFVMQAYCAWLPLEEYDRLSFFFGPNAEGVNSERFDRAVTAYQAYLHRTPKDDLPQFWPNSTPMSYSQMMLLDRFLYAPEPLKPKAIARDVQEVENDFTLTDPLDIRGY